MTRAWYERWFGEEYLDLYPHRDDSEARRQVDFACEVLGPLPEPILDLACGNGRHAESFAARGHKVLGLDLSFPLLTIARRRRCGSGTLFVRADMRRQPITSGTVGTVVNFFTSFGYFLSQEDDLRALSELARILRPGGLLFCDTFNREWVLGRLVAFERWGEGEKRTMVRRWYDAETRRVNKEIRVEREATTETFLESVRAYDREELHGLFRRAGLAVTKEFGDFDGSPHVREDSPRLILLAEKAG